jgi:hypothetical protein
MAFISAVWIFATESLERNRLRGPDLVAEDCDYLPGSNAATQITCGVDHAVRKDSWTFRSDYRRGRFESRNETRTRRVGGFERGKVLVVVANLGSSFVSYNEYGTTRGRHSFCPRGL